MKILLNPLFILALLFAGLSLFSIAAGGMAIKRKKFFGGLSGLLLGLVFLCLGALLGTLTVSTLGYRGMIHEETAAIVKLEPAGPHSFTAQFRFADGREASFRLEGDELYVDAHILKWRPIANFFGLHTAYELDRVAGRYSRLKDEQSKPRTIYSLGREKPWNIFDLRRRYSFLKPLLDAEYGSATFIAATKKTEVEVQVSTTGLLIRPVQPKGTSHLSPFRSSPAAASARVPAHWAKKAKVA